MSFPTARQHFFVNAHLLARADGRTSPEEQRLLDLLAEQLGVTPEERARWISECGPDAVFLPMRDQAEAREILGLMIQLAGADGLVLATEKQALLRAGKVMGLPAGELDVLVQAMTGAHLSLAATEAVRSAAASQALVTVLSDHYESLPQLLDASAGLPLDVRTLDALKARRPPPEHVVFHALDDRQASLEIVARVRRAAPKARIIPVVRRDQGYLVSYLLEAGVQRCIVEPVYPGELEGAVGLQNPSTSTSTST